MSINISAMLMAISKAYEATRHVGPYLQVRRIRTFTILVVGSGPGNRVLVNGLPILDCQRWAPRDSTDAPMILQTQGADVAVLLAQPGMVLQVRGDQYYMVSRDKLVRINSYTYAILLEQHQAEAVEWANPAPPNDEDAPVVPAFCGALN